MRFCVPVLSVSDSVLLYGSLCGQSCNATFRRLRRLQERGGTFGRTRSFGSMRSHPVWSPRRLSDDGRWGTGSTEGELPGRRTCVRLLAHLCCLPPRARKLLDC